MYDWIRPQIVVPVRGEPRHLTEHARFARSLGADREPVDWRGIGALRPRLQPVQIIDGSLRMRRSLEDGPLVVRQEEAGGVQQQQHEQQILVRQNFP